LPEEQPVKLEKQSSERLNRALAAYLRQEVQAPATAVTEFLGMIIEEARNQNLVDMLSDLDRMHIASVKLNTFVKGLIDSSASGIVINESEEEFHRRLRHDLRTPLNAIIGYSELLIEDIDGDSAHSMRDDLTKLRESAGHLLGQIDAMVALTHRDDGASQNGSVPSQLLVVADVLRATEPLTTAAALTQACDVLVVDDNASNRDVLARRLIRDGHRVTTVDNGRSALDCVEKQSFDLILLDLIMQEMSGFEVLRRLKSAEHSAHVPVIIVSALDEIDSIVRCIEAGADDYLPKPFDPTLLRARINASLERKLLRDREKNFIADLEQEKRRSETLLLNILPQSIVERMRDGEATIADRVEETTILFCDLVGFTALSQNMSPDEVIDLLGNIFLKFDRLVAEEGVEKIKTIGDAYMAAAGVPEVQEDHANRIAKLSLRMLETVREISREMQFDLQVRIGIHSGPVVAGVIGAHKFAYDVWGDTVNTASRMEYHSESGRIQVSAVARDLLDDRFLFEPRGKIEIKGMPPMETYFLVGPRPLS
jgi:adenylate cyclase